MSLFDFFGKNKKLVENSKSDLLKPKVCVGVTSAEVLIEIDKIDWSQFGTAYGNARDTIPYYLKNIFCPDKRIALDATHQLWCSICHQGVSMTNAALPAYEILKKALLELSNDIKAEILDIFVAFALCTSKEYNTVPNELFGWEREIQKKLLRDRSVFYTFEISEEEELSSMAKIICEYLDNHK
jgi:hypothetical protein